MTAAGPTPVPGRLAIVLHTHMPLVLGHGTWPFGEEWLWEAALTSWLRVLPAVEAHPALTLSVTPPLADQLLAPGVGERLHRYVREARDDVHARDDALLREAGETGAADGLAAQAAEVRRVLAAQAPDPTTADGLGMRLLRRAQWTSSATHAVLPLLATDAGRRAQLDVGIDGHRRRAGHWDGGFWTPECAHEPALDPVLHRAGVRVTCVDLTDVWGRGAPRHLHPLRVTRGPAPLIAPIDWHLVGLAWDPDGYPRRAPYRDSFRRTGNALRPWSNDGAPWDPERARAAAQADGEAFAAAAAERLAGGGLAVCAFDTELFGHWWFEGPWWLEAVLEALPRHGVELVALDAEAADAAAVDAPGSTGVASTWGRPRDLATWSGPPVADLAWRMRALELEVVARGRTAGETAWRELLALQSSDWAFLQREATAGDYPGRRAAGHAAALRRALGRGAAGSGGPGATDGPSGPSPGNLSPFLGGPPPVA